MFLPFEFVSMFKALDLLNLILALLEQYTASHINKDYFQLLKGQNRIYSRHFARLQNPTGAR